MSVERRVEVTSSAWILNPERLFWIVGQINRDRPPDTQIGLELYPVHYFMDARLGPGRVGLDRIANWRGEHGTGWGEDKGIPIERIHLPFHYSLPTAFKNFFWNSLVQFAKPYEPGTLKDRWIAMQAAFATGTVQNNFAINMAGELGAGLNAHRNIAEEAGKRDKLDKLRGNSKYIWVENDLDYPRSRRDQFLEETDPQKAIKVVERYGLEGVIYGLDHAYRGGREPREDFDKLQEKFGEHLRVIHLSGSRGDHDLIWPITKDFWDFMEFLKGKISDNVRFCLDLSPLEMKHLSPQRQLAYIRDLVGRLERS